MSVTCCGAGDRVLVARLRGTFASPKTYGALLRTLLRRNTPVFVIDVDRSIGPFDDLVSFLCPFCRHRHTHGLDKTQRWDVRVSHCDDVRLQHDYVIARRGVPERWKTSAYAYSDVQANWVGHGKA